MRPLFTVVALFYSWACCATDIGPVLDSSLFNSHAILEPKEFVTEDLDHSPVLFSRVSCRDVFVVTRQDTRNDECRPNDCTFTEAAKAANQCPGKNTIRLGRGIHDTNRTIDITDQVIIEGQGSGQTIIRNIRSSPGVVLQYVFYEEDPNRWNNIEGVTIDGDYTHRGLWLNTKGPVYLYDVNIRNCVSDWSGGAIFFWGTQLYYVKGLVFNNRAVLRGGGIDAFKARLYIHNVDFINNTAGDGGAIYTARRPALEGPGYHLSITDSRFIGNRAIGNDERSEHQGVGGAISSEGERVWLRNLVLQNNVAVQAAGGISLSGTTRASDLTIRRNEAPRAGGMLSFGDLRLTRATIANNEATAGNGGGAIITDDFLLTDVSVTDNRVSKGGQPDPVFGGGLLLGVGGDGAIRRSRITGNQADHGGGVATAATVNQGLPTTLTNVTIGDNQAEIGGGVFHSSGYLALNNVSVVDNAAVNLGAALFTTSAYPIIFGQDYPRLFLSHTIVADRGETSAANLCFDNHNVLTGGADAGFRSEDYNLFGDANCMATAANDVVAIDPLLAPLGDNGGETWSYEPVAGSPAINAGAAFTVDPGVAGCSREDQRGTARPKPVGSLCDIGSVEVEP